MTDIPWPDDLVPYAQSFYLQPYTGGSESPFSRTTKVYGLAKPRWICSMSFRGGYWGTREQDAFGPRLDAFLAKLKGRQNRVAIYDFRRSKMRSRAWPSSASNNTASLGATSMTITGLRSGMTLYAGDYIGGDGRPHIITDDVLVSGSTAGVNFEPPLSAAVGVGAAIFGNPTGMFRLTDDDAGQNGATVGESINLTLNFVEDL